MKENLSYKDVNEDKRDTRVMSYLELNFLHLKLFFAI